jgi:5-carboxymethyl-2-hydroxymuconate isomerase
MPHITLEYSNNINIEKDFRQLFFLIHQAIHQTLGIDTLNMKSRAIALNDYFIEDGSPDHAFAHLQIKFLDRHQPASLKKLGDEIFNLMVEFFEGQTDALIFQPSFEITEINHEFYFKWNEDRIRIKH